MTDTRRLDGVDVLRGLSILAVILLHIELRLRIAGFPLAGTMPAWLRYLLFSNGGNGVTVFFAVSGFLITRTSIRRFGSLAQMRPSRFYRIRFARIAPLLLLLLAILSVLHLGGAEGFVIPAKRATLPRALFAALTFHLNWLEASRGFLPPNWDVLWSLSIEEMFYLFFPLLCVLLFRFRWGTTLFIVPLLAFVMVGPFQRAVWSANEIWKDKAYLSGMDGIALGCLTALLTDRLRNIRANVWLHRLAGATGAAMMLLVAVWPNWHWLHLIGRHGFDNTLVALGACLVIMATVLTGMTGNWFTAPIRWLGRHSYEVYLTHEFVVVWGTMLYAKLHSGPLPVWFIAIAALSALPGAILARYFSEPLNRRLRGATVTGGHNAKPEVLAENAA